MKRDGELMVTLYGAVAGAIAMWALLLTRHYSFDAGYMSRQWLADYRAHHFD